MPSLIIVCLVLSPALAGRDRPLGGGARLLALSPEHDRHLFLIAACMRRIFRDRGLLSGALGHAMLSSASSRQTKRRTTRAGCGRIVLPPPSLMSSVKVNTSVGCSGRVRSAGMAVGFLARGNGK
jgi:hypothetical protein